MAVNKRLLQGATGGGALTPSENFKVVTYTGTGSAQSITGVGFKPDMVWIKDRIQAYSHNITDTSRGTSKQVFPNNTNAQDTTYTNRVTSFDADGFTIGNDNYVNTNGNTFVAWCWKAGEGTTSSNTDGSITSTVQANTDAGFSITTFSGTGSTGTVGHGLSAQPNLVLFKSTNTAVAWYIFYRPTGGNVTIFEGFSTAAALGSNYTNFVPEVDTVNIQNVPDFNQSGRNYIMYSFASVEGFSSFGTYTGNGDANGPIVETGFEPAFLMLKRTDGSAGNWFTFDNKRSPINERNDFLHPNSDAGETVNNSSYTVDFLSNGFQIKGNGDQINGNNGTHIYMAFAADPDTEAPTLADSFNIKTYTGTGATQSIEGLGFSPSLVWTKDRGNAEQHQLHDIVRGATKAIASNLSNAEATRAGGLTSFDSDGFSLGSDGAGIINDSSRGPYVAWSWKADDNEATIEEVTEDLDAVAVYKFEDNGDDVTGSYDATSLENITYSSSGKFNKAIEFNGSNSAFRTTGTLGLTGNMDFGVSFWMNADTLSGDQFLWGSGVGGANFGQVGLMIRDNTTIYADNRGNTDPMTSSQSLSTGTWYHIVQTYSASAQTHYLYINGSYIGSVGTVPINITTNNGSTIGIRPVDDSYRFDGRIDQFRVYHATLTSSNVATLYAETAAQNDSLSLGMTYVASLQSIVSANANAGFSIVKWTGTGAINKVPHGLSAAPEVILIKDLDSASDWQVYHTSIGNGNKLVLNSTATASSTTRWDSTSPTATVFTLRDIGLEGGLIAYCFHSVSGYSAFGSYAGNGTSQSINIGFKPDLLILRKYDDNQDWMIWDSVRDGNPKEARLEANNSDAEVNGTTNINFISTGFEFTSGYYNDSGQNSIYMAFKMNPTPYPLAGNMSFLVIAGGGGGGYWMGGGAGAGGLRTSYGSTSGGGASAESDITLASGTYTIIVGAAGTGMPSGGTTLPSAGNGGDSSIAASGLTTITSIGGGGGGAYAILQPSNAVASGANGGSGGGAWSISNQGQSAGTGTANQGYAGALGGNQTSAYGEGTGGGGGAAGAGTQGINGARPNGGDGLTVEITGSSVSYAGGGGGATTCASPNNATNGGLGGTGGGGNGGYCSAGNDDGGNGTTNTGGGGGGSSAVGTPASSGGTAGNGGSGVVILRLLTSEYSSSTTGSPTVTTDGDYTILTYTGSGTYVHS